jgi:hypothetical protein
MAAGDLVATTGNISSLSELIKVKYGKAIPHLFSNMSPFSALMKGKKNFSKTNGGRQLEFPYKVKRGENAGVRTRGDYLPGFGGNALDALDTMTAETAVVNRARIYSGFALDGEWLDKPNKEFMFNAGDRLAEHITDTLEDLNRELIGVHLMGDGTGYLGRVNGVVSASTTITLHPASTVDSRGRTGNMLFRPNQLLMVIPAAHWATSARASQADSDEVFKVAAVSAIGDVGASPTITSTAAITLADGDVIVPFGSRTSTSGGSGSGATLYNFNGLFEMIDDGTLNSSLYGLSRTTFSALKSPVDLASSSRPTTWRLAQSLYNKLLRRAPREKIAKLTMVSEFGVQAAFVNDDANPLKQYVQGDKALKHLAGFDDVSVVFLGGNKPMPWITDRDVPYGHLLMLDLDDIHAMWDRPIGVIDEDGLDLRMTQGKDEYHMLFGGRGNFMMEEPMHAARASALESAF